MVLEAFPLVSLVGSSFYIKQNKKTNKKKPFMCMYVHVSVGACGGERVKFPVDTSWLELHVVAGLPVWL